MNRRNHILKIDELDWIKMDGLIPAIVQDARSSEVLMLAYMNQEALAETLKTEELTFYSRSKKRLWRKGETSDNTMAVQEISKDCDGDSLLIQVIPAGPACHLGLQTCFQPPLESALGFLNTLINVIKERAKNLDPAHYTSQLIASGLAKCAQKVGEEAIETVIAALGQDRDEMINETADLIFHLLVLLEVSQIDLAEIVDCLKARHISFKK